MIVADTHVYAGAFVATDTRVRYLDNSVTDPGGKIVRTRSGWATGTGGFKQVITALAALRDAPEQTGVDRTRRATDIVSGALSRAGLELRGWEAKEEIFGSSWATRGAVVLIEPRQEIVLFRNADSQVVYHAGAGPADFQGWDDTYIEMRADIENAHDLGGRIRAAAKHFAATARASSLMSDVMEVGWICPSFLGPFHGFLRGDAEEIAETEGRHILKRFHADPPTALPPSSRDSNARSVSTVVDLAPMRLTGGGATPAITIGDPYWNGTCTIVGTDTAGLITLVKTTTSSTQHATGHEVKVTFAAPYATAPFVIFSTDLDSAFGLILGQVTTDYFYIDCNTSIPRAGAVAATGVIHYAVIG